MLKRIDDFINIIQKRINENKYCQIISKYNNEINFFLLLFSFILFISYYLNNNFLFLLWASVILWIHNVIFSLKNIKNRILFFMFHITYFLFLLGRPIFTLIFKWNLLVVQIEYGATVSGVILSFKIIYISLLFIFIGNRLIELYNHYIKNNKNKDIKSIIYVIEGKDSEFLKVNTNKKNIKKERMNLFRYCILAVLIVSFIADFILGMEKLIFILNNSYVDSYLSFKSQIPYIVYVISSFFEYAVYLYLATFPNKRNSIFCMIAYVFSAVPSFVGGERNPICLAILFCIIYVVIRQYSDEDSWISKGIVFLGIVLAFVGMIALGVINYIREGTSLGSLNPFIIIEDFIYKQGVTFSWICVGFSRLSVLRNQKVISYTFGSLIDYVKHNKVSQILFGTTALSNTNSIEMARYSNEMSHHLSYSVLGDQYLQGHGTGTSFLLEVFTDYGWIGIICISIILGILFYYVYKLCTRNYVWKVFMLCMITGILFMPRGDTIDCLSFLWRMAFWTCLILCIGLYSIIILLKKKRKRVNL